MTGTVLAAHVSNTLQVILFLVLPGCRVTIMAVLIPLHVAPTGLFVLKEQSCL